MGLLRQCKFYNSFTRVVSTSTGTMSVATSSATDATEVLKLGKHIIANASINCATCAKRGRGRARTRTRHQASNVASKVKSTPAGDV